MYKTIIYCSYHDKNQLIDYKLKNNNILKLFYTNDLTLKEDNINNLNQYLSEIVTYYYVWKNQIKSDYIGFCHYRRHFQNIQYNYIDDNHIQTLSNNYINIKDNPFSNMFIDYMKIKYNYIINDNILKCSFKLSYIMTWNVFNNVCNFIFGFYDYIGNLLNIDWKIIEGQNIIIKYILSKKDNIENWEYNWTRYMSVISEFLLGCYINILYNTDDFKNIFHNNIIILLKHNINQIYNCERLGISCNDIFIYSESEYNKRSENIPFYNFDLNKSYVNIETLLNIIKENINNKKIIILNNNEYIDCENSFEFYKNNYKIINIFN